MISTVSLSFDLTYTNPVTGALQPRGIVVDSTDYAGLGLDLLVGQVKGLGVITFNGDIIVDLNTVGTPMIDLQNWDYVNDGVPTYTFDLPLDLNGNVSNGVYAFTYSLRVLADPFTGITLGGVVTAPNVLTVTSNEWLYQFLEEGDTLSLNDGINIYTPTVSSTSYSDPDSVILLVNSPAPAAYVVSFSLTNVQLSGVYSYSGCTQVNADVSFVYDCEVGDSGTWAVANTTPLASNEVVASLNCTISYPSWATLSPTFPGNVVVTSLPYPSAPGVETPLATGTYTVSLTEQIQQTQTSGLIVLYSKSVIKEFQVSCAGTLCGLIPCIENLRAAHQAELVRNKVSKYQVYVDNVLMYYIEALNYKACGELDKYKEAIARIEAQLDSSGCECACCDDETYYWVSNNSGVSVIESLISSFQFRLFNLDPVGPGSPLDTNDVTQGVEIGALWENVNTGVIYRCTNNTEGGAIWEEYYAPGVTPDAIDVPAVPSATFLTANNVQGQLDQVEALAIFGGENGLTKNGNNLGLGGVLDTDTTIDVNGNDFIITSDDATLEVIATAGTPLLLNVNQGFSGVGINAVLTTTNTAGVGANGIGSSIQFVAENAAGTTSLTSTVRSTWVNAAASNSNFQITTKNANVESPALTLNFDGSATLNGYNSTTFEDPAPAYLLGVDASGNVVQAPANPIIYAGRTRFSGGAVIIAEYGNTTGATISISNTGVGVYTLTASSPVFTATSTVAFVQMQTAGFVDVVVTSTTVITIRTYDTAGVANDAVIAAGSYVKVEIY